MRITMPTGAGVVLGAVLTSTLMAAGPPSASADTEQVALTRGAAPAAAPAALQQRGWRCRTATSTVTGAKVTGRICWSGYKIKASGMMYDTKGDHKSAGVKVHVVTPSGVVRTGYLDWIDGSKPGKKESWGETETGYKYWFKACVSDWRKTKCASRWS
ncbi:hypothetical protein GCM10010402_00440 [Actinomadura luteofluorescens]|uniref:hypothetical protein n=1 Tax=Actinomadura luteofluorescens TaxID=46163 RepID=UPI002164E754|nr:hypothetical protein [Actinomadura glauciflava]MCR3745882.1 hypothetical protein [Actinomadura glauciflava]